MRRILLLLFVCLLPLQSFAGYGMALRALEKASAPASVPSAAALVSMSTAMPCHESMAALDALASVVTSQSTSVADDDCCTLAGACAVMCHLTAAMLPLLPGVPAMDTQSHRAAGRIPALRSASVAPAIKPPIF